MIHIINPLYLKFTAYAHTFSITDHSLAWIDVDKSALGLNGLILLMSILPSSVGGGDVGVRENGSAQAPIFVNIAQWQRNDVLVQLDSAGIFEAYASASNVTYEVKGFFR